MDHLHAIDRPYLNTDDLSARWSCEPKTVRNNWRKWGLKGIRFGKRLVFTLDSVEAFERKRLSKAVKGKV